MPITLSLNAITHNTATIGVAGTAGGATQYRIRLADNDKFRGHVIEQDYDVANVTFIAYGLNQNSRWFLQAKSKLASGAYDAWGPALGIYTPQSAGLDLTVPSNFMSPALIVVPEPVVSWSATNELAAFPARNLDRDDPSLIFQVADGVNPKITLQMTGAPIDTIALLGTTAPENATITVRAAATQGGLAAPAYSIGPLPFRASPNLPQRHSFHSLVSLPAPQSYRWWQIEVGNAGRMGFFQASYAVLGLNRKTKNISADKQENIIELGGLTRGREGNPDRISGFRLRKVDFEISLLSEIQWETQFSDLRARIGLTEPVLVVPNSKAGTWLHDRILYGPLVTQRSVHPYSPYFTQQLSIESLI